MRAHQITFVMLAAIALAACGSSDDDANDRSDPSTTAPTVTTAGPGSSQPADTATVTSTTTPPPATDGPAGNGDDEIDSVQWGPDDPPIPDQYRAFAADDADGLACDSIGDQVEGDEFWTLARDICRVFAGDGDWPDATTVPVPGQDGNIYERCLDGELSQVLERALAWHAAHPGETPLVRFPPSGRHSPCQTSLYDVGVTDTQIDADHGCENDESSDVPTAGIPVSVSAPGILGFAHPQASVDGAALCVIDDSTDDALRTFVVVVPTSGDAHTVTIAVETKYGLLSATVELPAIDVEPTDSEPADSEPTVTDDGPTDSSDDEQGTPDDS